MVRRAIALVAMGLCACNAIIGLDQPTFVGPEDDGATSPPTLDAGGAEDGASQGGAPEDGTAPDARDASLAASDATDATPAGDATDATLLDGRAPPLTTVDRQRATRGSRTRVRDPRRTGG